MARQADRETKAHVALPTVTSAMPQNNLKRWELYLKKRRWFWSKADIGDKANSFPCEFTKGKSRQHTGEIHKVAFLDECIVGMHWGFNMGLIWFFQERKRCPKKSVPKKCQQSIRWIFLNNIQKYGFSGRKVWLCHVQHLLRFHQLTVATTGILSLEVSNYQIIKLI